MYPKRIHGLPPLSSPIVGPTLFILFINDITHCVTPGTQIALYADDTNFGVPLSLRMITGFFKMILIHSQHGLLGIK